MGSLGYVSWGSIKQNHLTDLPVAKPGMPLRGRREQLPLIDTYSVRYHISNVGETHLQTAHPHRDTVHPEPAEQGTADHSWGYYSTA